MGLPEDTPHPDAVQRDGPEAQVLASQRRTHESPPPPVPPGRPRRWSWVAEETSGVWAERQQEARRGRRIQERQARGRAGPRRPRGSRLAGCSRRGPCDSEGSGPSREVSPDAFHGACPRGVRGGGSRPAVPGCPLGRRGTRHSPSHPWEPRCHSGEPGNVRCETRGRKDRQTPPCPGPRRTPTRPRPPAPCARPGRLALTPTQPRSPAQPRLSTGLGNRAGESAPPAAHPPPPAPGEVQGPCCLPRHS